MRKFLSGFVAGVAVIALAEFCYVRLGFLDTRADIPVNPLEQKIAMPSLDASVDRRAPDLKNPVDASDANLMSGMKIYQANCAGCHGDVSHPHGMLADSLYPRAPQFAEDSPNMPENQNFYIIQHGIRLSGMPAWKQWLSDQQMWQVTTFLSHMDKLPTQVSEQWRADAGSSTVKDSSPHSSPMDQNMPMK
jgi:mono/diheme cytochrome c family protein